MEELRETDPGLNRPGGFEITDRAISFCSFQPGAKIIDLGCGKGATVDHLIKNYRLDAYGIDIKPDTGNESKRLFRASAEDIPMPTNCAEGVMMECSFSLMTSHEKVLKECRRVLKTNGRLVISDMYAKGEPAYPGRSTGHLFARESIVSMLESSGFRVDLFENFTSSLKSFWGQMIFDKGADNFYRNLGMSHEEFKRIKCGYYLLVASKKDKSE